MTIDLRQRGVEVVVLDIEGTTTPIRFVGDVLFPYARAHLRAYIDSHPRDFEEWHRLFAAEHASDVANGQAPPMWREGSKEERANSVIDYAEWLMERDRKSTALKLLQGRIWEGGYRDGLLRGEVFSDVPPALARWRAAGISVAIYSSGSVLAQRLLFGSTVYGDLTAFMLAFFDTMIGPKIEPQSFLRIAMSLERSPDKVVFVSDVPKELVAARAAGVGALLCLRPGNAEVADADGFDSVRSFDELVA